MRPLGTASGFPADALHQALELMPEQAWGQLSTLEQSGTHHGYRTLPLIQPDGPQPHARPFRFVLAEFQPVYQAWLSWLEPGGYILPHIDAGPYYERWQVPIQAAGQLGGSEAQAGLAFRVEHWESHSVTNTTGRPRVHIVIDRDLIVDASPVLFHRTELKEKTLMPRYAPNLVAPTGPSKSIFQPHPATVAHAPLPGTPMSSGKPGKAAPPSGGKHA